MLCDKCGKEVDASNDATIIDAIVHNQPLIALVNGARHFLPTQDCEGSPSRAQYIEGQPKDARGYPYVPEYEDKYRKALKKAQELYL